MSDDTAREDEAYYQRLVRLAMSMYLGERCKYCGREFATLDDLRDAVWVGQHEHGSLAHEDCYQRNL
ncbi:MAG: hypothetical protein GX465_15805 [Acidobacteria bacterium]|nr:hypothetical protein [Acidobacteriota bacterium]